MYKGNRTQIINGAISCGGRYCCFCNAGKNMPGIFAGKNALVTGAGRRLGREIALALAGEGCNIILHYHDSEEDAREVAALAGEILSIACQKHDPHENAYDVFLNYLEELNRGGDVIFLALKFLLEVLPPLGYAPQLHNCANCGKELKAEEKTQLSGKDGGLICAGCAGGAGKFLPQEATRMLREISSPEQSAADKKMPKRLLMALLDYIQYNLARELRSAKVFSRLAG